MVQKILFVLGLESRDTHFYSSSKWICLMNLLLRRVSTWEWWRIPGLRKASGCHKARSSKMAFHLSRVTGNNLWPLDSISGTENSHTLVFCTQALNCFLPHPVLAQVQWPISKIHSCLLLRARFPIYWEVWEQVQPVHHKSRHELSGSVWRFWNGGNFCRDFPLTRKW